MGWTHVETAATWEEWETLATEIGAVVKDLKTGGGDKEAVDAAVAELLHRKEKLRGALEEAIAKAPDEATAAALKAKLPPAPKSKADKKKEAKESKGGGGDAEKAANIKANEEAKAAARARKKAEQEAKKAGESGGAPAKPSAAPKPDAAAPAAPKAAAAAGGARAGATAPPAPVASTAPAADKKVTAGLNKTTELYFAKEAPPLLALLAARLAKHEVVLKKVEARQLPAGSGALLVLPLNGGKYSGEHVIARYMARLPGAGGAPSLLYGSPGDGVSATDVDQWIDRAEGLSSSTGAHLTAALAELNHRLAMRTTIAGHAVTIGDGAVWLALKRNAAASKAAASGGAWPHLKRWLRYMEALPACLAIAQDFFGAAKDAGSMELNLTDAEVGKVVTRFPPEPSGHLHIGHVKAAMLNAHFASKYEGKMLLRFDDTNPSKEKEEYEDAIVRDLARLEIVPASVSHTSDWFPQIKEIATRMIHEGLAYVDPSPQEEQKTLRFEKKANQYRTQPVEENLRLWGEMHLGSEEGLKCCLRAKIDMTSDNGALRDPTIYRTNLTPHAKTKDTYKAYPTYDLACPIVDALEGVTHALRDLQYSDRNAQYNWFLTNLRLRKVHLEGFSRINFVRTLLSKRKLQWLIDEKKAEGWDDPRFPTVAGILRRGMTVPGLKTFILGMGASKNSNLMEWDSIWAKNRAIVDPLATRYTALLADGAVPFVLSNGPAKPYAETLFRHPKDEALGRKVRMFASTVLLQQEDATAIAEGEEITLMSWGNAIVRRIERTADGKGVAALHGELHLEGNVKSTKKKLTWLADTAELVDVTLVDLDFLLSKDKVEEDDNLKDIFTENSVLPAAAKGEPAMRTMRKGEIIQVERRGFYVCDVPYVRPSEPMVLYFVPDGKNMFGIKR